ncbi:MAG: hypothetical protein COV74_03035 [Candidatus Omnitrophica bacterium CG11_big_fil_rev_8_21_14_0_20_45_26]|uniref:Glycosyltransferase 2-like domain-containing protein n=1 Tax=Candidatus Abzuiibacterium crystallinum TaxID=1974748 RepID=A0A2H0LQY0_9BACT|nr:MAG: hypothetical protein COV74_03035 [Candidatus Omnitrophica bacterium CG11_big_fil_rev_8_21_14_0_20_45_26]PIW64652.1 MAG: hypothetical protein COW12_05060 [Candidatus Omnitrophica bacterium CG12_big_fil_rev_8_21_14_0_65_45_16]
MPKPYLSVTIPAYNEAGTIQKVVEDHLTVLEALQPELDGFEVLCLDDASHDNTCTILTKLADQTKEIRVMRHTTNQGIYRSFRDLFHEAKGTHIFQTAADDQWPAGNLVKLFHRMQKDRLDLVIGVRENRKKIYTPWRQFLSFGFNLIPKCLFGIDTKDANGIKLGRKEIFTAPLMSQSFFGEIERIVEAKKRGFRIDCESIDFLPRTQGRASGAKWRNIYMTFFDLMRYTVKRR